MSSSQLHQTLTVPESLLQKYNTSGPRYTSYPTAPVWKEDVNHQTFEAVVNATNRSGLNQTPLSLYVHLPFCEHRCLFCACNVVITQQREQAEKYLNYLFRELEMTAALMDTRRPVVQFHWGGGTPTYLSPEQIERLFRFQTRLFRLHPHAEVAIEVDPRVTTSEQIQLLRELGFNRVSMGLQDFDPQVQEAVGRIQPRDMTERLIQQCRDLGFSGLNIDLIYGLPHQTVESFDRTLDAVLEIAPDRLALYNYAHVPWIAPHQNQIPADALPSGPVKFQIFRRALERFLDAGYQYIGMDHFAKPGDELSKALADGTLHRNFMGYTTRAGTELYGFGVSAISSLMPLYSQNQKKLSTYYEAIENNRLPTHRGYMLTDDDHLRRWVIQNILCQGRISFTKAERKFDIDFKRYFAEALTQMNGFVADGLISLSAEGLSLTPLGRVFSRNIAMTFDAYLRPEEAAEKPLFSKTL